MTPLGQSEGVITVEHWAEIRRLHLSEQLGVKTIARRLGLARNTVRSALAAFESVRRRDQLATSGLAAADFWRQVPRAPFCRPRESVQRPDALQCSAQVATSDQPAGQVRLWISHRSCGLKHHRTKSACHGLVAVRRD